MSKAIKHMIVVVFMLLCMFCLLMLWSTHVFPQYVSSNNTKPMPTVQDIVAQWELVDVTREICGSFSWYVNLNPTSQYAVAYVHTCTLHEGRISQYGFLDTGKLREFHVDIDSIAKEFYRSQPNLLKQLKSYLIPIGMPI